MLKSIGAGLLAILAGCATSAGVSSSVGSSAVVFSSARLSSLAESQPVINGVLTKPDGPGPFPAVVLLHGCSGPGTNLAFWAHWLRERGYAALAIDSFAPRGVHEICTDFSRVTANERLGDAFGGLDYLASQPFVDPNRIAVMGFSNGGVIALDVASLP